MFLPPVSNANKMHLVKVGVEQSIFSARSAYNPLHHHLLILLPIFLNNLANVLFELGEVWTSSHAMGLCYMCMNIQICIPLSIEHYYLTHKTATSLTN